jgi:hypothetical protein
LNSSQNSFSAEKKFDWVENMQTTKSQTSDTQFLKGCRRRESLDPQRAI